MWYLANNTQIILSLWLKYLLLQSAEWKGKYNTSRGFAIQLPKEWLRNWYFIARLWRSLITITRLKYDKATKADGLQAELFKWHAEGLEKYKRQLLCTNYCRFGLLKKLFTLSYRAHYVPPSTNFLALISVVLNPSLIFIYSACTRSCKNTLTRGSKHTNSWPISNQTALVWKEYLNLESPQNHYGCINWRWETPEATSGSWRISQCQRRFQTKLLL